mgnify:CR=1 FL=1
MERTPSAIVMNGKVVSGLTIKEVSETYDISADTLRYYERIGMIPEVTRTAGGIRDYQESDLGWVELVICMRKAGLPVEALIEYVKLYQEGDETFEARLQLLSEEREKLEEQKAQIESAINRLNHKISKYEEAVKKLKIPILFLGQRFPGENSVINDDYNAGYAVGNYIGQRKFKEIYMLWVPEDDPAVGGERRHGVIDGLMSCEKKPKEVIETTFFYENAIENVQKFVDHMKTPAAVVCATDRIAFGVYKVMSEKGIQIPEEVSVVGFGDYEAGELLQPPLTTVKFDWKNWGEISAESMIQMILGKPVSPLQVNPYEIIERKSVKEN